MKYLFTLFILIFFQSTFAQDSFTHTFGQPLREEFAMSTYHQDTEATGVVLYERGNYTVDVSDGYIRLIKNVHRKIKVFDAKNFKYASVEIPYYRESNIRENVTNLKAITHNGTSKEYISKESFFDNAENPYWSTIKFTFPNVRNGSILEYSYQVETPYFSLLGGWEFMNELPTIYSELHTEIPGNFIYNRSLYGDRELDVNHAEIKKSCFHLPGFKVPGDCESATYIMKHIPAFKEEKYMLSRNNYIPALKFELKKIIDLDESKKNYTTTWKEVDNRFKNDKDLGRQLKYANFFKEKMPASILSIADDLDRAKAVYYYIQERMNWNGQKNILSGIRVKEAFESKSGNSSEINLSLINALEAAGLNAKIMLISTRDRAIPSKQYPVLTDFNYAIVFLKIKDQKYILDATDKNTSFGILPLHDLNVEGRVLDFKSGSYWESIQPEAKNVHYINLQMATNEVGIFTGKITEISTGFIAAKKRKENNGFRNDEILKRKQSANEALNILSLSIENDSDLEQPYKEIYDIDIAGQKVSNTIYLYPFPQSYFSENPFTEKTRKYPIDFAFPFSNTYLISIDLGDIYEIGQLPKSRSIKLPNDDGECSITYISDGNKINIRFNMKLAEYHFAPDANQSLKEFFGTMIAILKEEPITLNRK
jgi:hypothetical protein